MKRVLFMYKVPGFAKAPVSAKASPRQTAVASNVPIRKLAAAGTAMRHAGRPEDGKSRSDSMSERLSLNSRGVAAPLFKLRTSCFHRLSCLHAFTVLLMSMAMVMGPTPPGTGVMAEHLSLTASKSTSPTMR